MKNLEIIREKNLYSWLSIFIRADSGVNSISKGGGTSRICHYYLPYVLLTSFIFLNLIGKCKPS